MHAYTHARMHACAHIRVHARTYTLMYSHTHSRIHPSIHPYMHPPSHPCTCGYLCVHIPVCVWACACMHLCIRLCVVTRGVIVHIYSTRGATIVCDSSMSAVLDGRSYGRSTCLRRFRYNCIRCGNILGKPRSGKCGYMCWNKARMRPGRSNEGNIEPLRRCYDNRSTV